MGREDLIAESHPFEQNIADIKGCQQPLELAVGEVEILTETCCFGIAYDFLSDYAYLLEIPKDT